MVGEIEGTGFNLVLPIVMGLLMSLVVVLLVSGIRQANRFFDKTRPFMKRAEACETMEEWEKLRDEIKEFYNNDKLGHFNVGYLNTIIEVLRIKKPYMK